VVRDHRLLCDAICASDPEGAHARALVQIASLQALLEEGASSPSL